MIPITLVGKNLGERHRYLNTAVNEAYKTQQDVKSLDGFPEQSPIDRIFKISLASKLRNVDYIIQNLKDDDMLYVSKALKCKWLLEARYEDIINPEYLEGCLYQSMITTAVNKMKHWLFLNLKDPVRCQIFYLYYCDTNFKPAVKFLRNCSADFITDQFSKQIHNISIHDFKIFCEKNSLIAKIFFDALLTDEVLKEKYLSNEKEYFTTLKSLLKSDATMVLDITEKYLNRNINKPFNSRATKFIMKRNRIRFNKKPELYTAFLLNFKTLVSSLNAEDAIDLTLTLSRDNYLESVKWFDYKKVEPLIKRIKPEDRSAFKKKVFVDKDIGTVVQKWSYEMPSSPERVPKSSPIFEDIDHTMYEYNDMDFRRKLKKRKYAGWAACMGCVPEKTMLDKLYDEYRVISYSKTLFELRKKIKAESSPQNRQYMMLVLVSKSGGHESNIDSFMQLLGDYKNEPSHLRAAVIRSLVKRAHVWRVPDETWKQLLDFAHGLGLDGNPPEAACIEGIHAVVIRQILVNGTCDPKILSIYLDNFSTLNEYTFSKDEENIISNVLPNLLYAKALEKTEGVCSANIINKLLDTLIAYKLSIGKYPGLIFNIGILAETNILKFSGILNRLFRSRIARRELFKVNFSIIETEDSYLNALRHDADIISTQKLIKLILSKNSSNYQQFFSKVSIYFNENDGIAKQFLNILKNEPANRILAKPLVLLLGDELSLYIKNVDSSVVDVKDKLMAAALRANAHLARPAFDIDTFGWSATGAKAIANKVLVCRNAEVNNYVQKLLQNKQTAKLGYLLAKRSSNSNYFHSFTVLSKFRPILAMKLGLQILMHDKVLDQADIWGVIKPLIENVNTDAHYKRYQKLPNVSSMPVQIQPAYAITLYKLYKKKSFYESVPFLYHIEKRLLHVSEEFIENVVVEYLKDGLPEIPKGFIKNVFLFRSQNLEVDCNCLFIRIIIKYMLLCKTEESQKKRHELMGVGFYNKIKTWLQSDESQNHCRQYLDEFLSAFRYYAVYLNSEYVSCMPVMNTALTWMKQNLPMEKHFKDFVHMHLNMLYYTSIRKSIDMLPDHSINDSNQMEARTLVGNIFGKHIAREINNLKMSYFDSVQYLYKDIFLNLHAYFHHACGVFTESLINGALDQSETSDNVLAVYLLKERSRSLGTTSRQDILLRLRQCKNIETQMIFFGEMYSQA